MTAPAAAPHWIPAHLTDDDGSVRCEWLDVGDLRFTDPFFESTLSRRRHDQHQRRSSALQQLHDEAATAVGPAPSAFIFHVSRCGSTLLSQLLACDEAAVVLSEVPLLDEILRSALPDREPLFAAALRLLGRRRFGGEERLFVKTDCWHIFYAAALRRLYPATPFILLYRSPGGVLGSHRRARGMHMVPGLLERAPFSVAYDPVHLSLDQYAAAVLEQYYRAMLDVASVDPHALLVSYDEGFPAAFERVAAWLDLPLDDPLRARIADRLTYDGKTPEIRFSAPVTTPPPDVDMGSLMRIVDALEDRRRSRLRRASRAGDVSRSDTH